MNLLATATSLGTKTLTKTKNKNRFMKKEMKPFTQTLPDEPS